MDLTSGLAEVRARIVAACDAAGRDPSTVQLLAVSKRQPLDKLRAVLAAGQRDLGESRVQELAPRAVDLADTEVRWHMIGPLQTNKVRDLVRAPRLAMVQSVDRTKLADALERALVDEGRHLDVLLQLNATREPQKHGFAPGDGLAALRHVIERCPHLRVRGLMAMGQAGGDPTPVFEEVARLRADWEQATGQSLPVLSLGMTADMEPAIAAGSTMVRIGTGVFGARS